MDAQTDEGRRRILEQIAEDDDNYPRDRIAAIRALRKMDQAGTVEDELDRILTK
jgi:hypothetical protein